MDEIIHDLKELWASPTPDMFECGIKLFVLKWTPVDTEATNHIKNQWFTIDKNWYAACHSKSPSTNNATEAFNAVFKGSFTKRERQPLGTFIDTMSKCIKSNSVDLSTNNPFVSAPTIKP